MISSPLRSRFSGGIFRLEFYTEQELGKIISRSAHILSVDLDTTAAHEISKRSRSTPRTANYLLKRCRDYAQVHKTILSEDVVKTTLQLLGVDHRGLTFADRSVIEALANKYKGGPVGLSTLAMSLAEEPATIEEFNEPYLIQIGFIERTSRGRTLTDAGYRHLKLDPPVR
jgi:Holliday junction DNA helicase RuvB